MKPHSIVLACLTAGIAICFGVEANAQMFSSSPSDGTLSGGVRIALVLAATAIGFATGWLTTPAARDARHIVFGIIAFVALLVVLVSDGAVGWGLTLLCAIVGFSAALGYWAKAGLQKLAETPTTFGSSRWANLDDLMDANMFDDKGIRLGEAILSNEDRSQEKDGEYDNTLYYNGDRHLLTVAPTRSGKGTTQIVPNLLTYKGSVLVIDPKGENAKMTAQRRKSMGQKVHIVDPWNITNLEGFDAAKFNPLDWLDATDPDIIENAMILADALVVEESHSDSFWTEEAKALLQGILLYVASARAEGGRRHLTRVRELLVGSKSEQDALFQKMAKSDHHIIRSTGLRCLQKDEKLLSSVLASAQAQTHFLDSDRLQKNLMESSFNFADLKSEPTTIYLVLPADRLNTFGRWLRLLVQQAITVNARNIDQEPEKPILFILDEFAALGRLSMVEQAYGLMAGFGMQLWGIVQDFNQLERIYDKGWQSFVANAGMINYFGSVDKMTAEYFSAMCGETTVWNISTAISRAVGSTTGDKSSSSSVTDTQGDTHAASQRKLIYPDELMRLGKGQQLIICEDLPPIKAERKSWLDDDELKHLGVNLRAKTKPTESAPTADDILNKELEDV